MTEPFTLDETDKQTPGGRAPAALSVPPAAAPASPAARPASPANHRGPSAAGSPVSRSLRLPKTDFIAAGIWVAANFVIWLCLAICVWFTKKGSQPLLYQMVERWNHWDFIHFTDIAQFGYEPLPGQAHTHAPLFAFFPAMPRLLRWGMHLGLPAVVAGLIVSFVAGGIAVVFLARLANLYFPGLGPKAALSFVVAPPAVFLVAPYTESLFLAFAISAWYFAKRNRWLVASLMCAGACTVRISGAFLLIALMVLWLMERRRRPARGARWSWLYLAIPGAALCAWEAYMWHRTGDPIAYQTAQKYWGRHFTLPWDALQTTLTSYGPTNGPSTMANLEVAAVLVGLVVTVVLIARKFYGEAVFVAINIAVLGTSTFFYSVPRSALLWWPLWIGTAYLLRKSKILFGIYIVLSASGMLWWACQLFLGYWAG